MPAAVPADKLARLVMGPLVPVTEIRSVPAAVPAGQLARLVMEQTETQLMLEPVTVTVPVGKLARLVMKLTETQLILEPVTVTAAVGKLAKLVMKLSETLLILEPVSLVMKLLAETLSRARRWWNCCHYRSWSTRPRPPQQLPPRYQNNCSPKHVLTKIRWSWHATVLIVSLCR